MHVHASAADGWLLDLAAGVTSVRDMAGFPWMLAARDRINARLMLAPVYSVAGPLINGFAMDGYSVVPANSADARRIVRQEAACGYDFIKVHNIVPGPIFDAVNAQAKALGMDVVGHVPHDITVAHAVAAGMRTMEHLKGFIDDRTLKAGETDFPAAAGGEIWNTPTLYAGRGYAHGDEARRLLAAPEMRYVPLRKKTKWSAAIEQAESRVETLGREAQPLMKSIVGELHRVHAQFLAGTDADNYPFQVMGFGLVEEVRLLQDAGLSPAEALRAATIEPARALRQPEEFGQVKRGMRADIVLLDANPLSDVAAYRSNRGVIAHGFWLSRDALDAALAQLEKIEAEPDAAVDASTETVSALSSRLQAMVADGFVFSAPRLAGLADALRASGSTEAAGQLEKLAEIRNTGPCADDRPR
jgi:imidazolonepropionase-like amidohydrolase